MPLDFAKLIFFGPNKFYFRIWRKWQGTAQTLTDIWPSFWAHQYFWPEMSLKQGLESSFFFYFFFKFQLFFIRIYDSKLLQTHYDLARSGNFGMGLGGGRGGGQLFSLKEILIPAEVTQFWTYLSSLQYSFIFIIVRFYINMQVQGQYPQWVPFQVTGCCTHGRSHTRARLFKTNNVVS